MGCAFGNGGDNQMSGEDASSKLRAAGLLDATPNLAFDRLTREIRETLHCDAATFSIIDQSADRQFFRAQCGLDEPLASTLQTPLSQSICRHVRDRAAPVVITDMLEEPAFRDHPAIREMGVRAYLGAPIFDDGNDPIGAICAISRTPRPWSEGDVYFMLNIATICTDLVTGLMRDGEMSPDSE